MTPSPGSLHDLLHDVAADQPAAAVPADTWRRGRRAHRRRVALTTAASAAAVAAVVVGVATLDVGSRGADAGPDVAGSETGAALPSRIYAVPSQLDYDGRSREAAGLARSPLAAGPLSVAFPAGEWSRAIGIIGVRADDGQYVELDLPGFSTDSSSQWGDNPAALSADGDRLAYSWRESDDPAVSGVRILDLRTGEVTDHPLPSERGVQVSGLSWSPDERYVAYNRRTVTSGTSGVRGARNYRVERLDTRTGDRTLVPVQPGPSAPAVNDAGVVKVPASRVSLPQDDARGRLSVSGSFTSIAWNDAGTALAMGTAEGGVAVVRRSDGAPVVPTPWEEDGGPAQVLGWAGPDTVAARGEDQVLLLSTTDAEAEPRELLTMDEQVVTPTVATDLLGVPTRDDPGPPWARSWWERAFLSPVTGLAVLALLVGGVVVTRLRRR